MKNWLLYIFLPILLTSCGEFIMKHTINTVHFHPIIFLAVSFLIGGSILWLYAMSKYQLSFLYPFLSMNFLIITVGSQFLLHENVSLTRYIAVGLIIIGLIIISKSPNTTS
jgi:drug/metabolite transporter (DMT)-like permease